MTIAEIKTSGLLEQYVLGLLSAEEVTQVEGYLAQYPELKRDISEIEYALKQVAIAAGETPRAGLENEIISSITGKQPSAPSSPSTPPTGLPSWLTPLAGALAIGALIWGIMLNTKVHTLNQTIKDNQAACDSITTKQANDIIAYKQLLSPEVRVIPLQATPDFAMTKLTLFTNEAAKQNFIKISELPPIAANETYQLWSLKAGVDPIPLSTFSGSPDDIVAIDFEDGTGTYAITIEQKGGAKVPNLKRLIATVGVSG